MGRKVTTVNFEKRTKRCSRCREWKPFELFAKATRKVHGLQGECKSCSLLSSIEYTRRKPGSRRKSPRDPEKRRLEAIKAKPRIRTPEQIARRNATQRAYRIANTPKVRMWNKLRHHMNRGAGPMPHPVVIGAMLCEQEYLCPYCGKELDDYHIDHKTPVSRGGRNDEENLHMVCPTCNLKKNRKTHEEYLATIQGVTG